MFQPPSSAALPGFMGDHMASLSIDHVIVLRETRDHKALRSPNEKDDATIGGTGILETWLPILS